MATEDDRRNLCERLARGHAVLFIGQGYLGLQETAQDDFLTPLRLSSAYLPVASYHDLIGRWPFSDREPRLFSVLQNMSRRIAVPDWLETVAKLPWNTVVNSAFDEVLERQAVSAEWRRVDPIWNSKREPVNPRDRILNCMSSNCSGALQAIATTSSPQSMISLSWNAAATP